jgi:hypothetical protein
MHLAWDGPFLGVMGTYGYFRAADATEEIFDEATPTRLEQAVANERHQIGLLASGGYELTDWLGVFLGLGARLDVDATENVTLLPDLTAGVLLF